MYKINVPYTSTMYLLTPTKSVVKGNIEKGYTKCEDSEKIKCLFKTYGGTNVQSTEKSVNGIISVVKTAVIETWYNKKITSDCRLAFNDNDKYDIIGEPENIENRNRTMKIKVKKVEGNA